jgi:predicted TPR repeat methyltransferase
MPMSDDTHDGHLGAVYAAGSPAQVAAAYDRWAETYEADMAASGYRHPTIALALLARHLPRGAGPILDAGVGTGLMGQFLPLVGYGMVDGLDLSAGMLAVAARKGVYRTLQQLALGGPLPYQDRTFAGVVSTGVFTTGHVGAEALPELIRICARGGVIVLTVKGTVWEAGFEAALGALQADGRIRMLEQTAPYLSMPGDPATTPGIGVVFSPV